MSRQRRHRRRVQIVATPETAEIANLRRHPERHRPGTSRFGPPREFLDQKFCLTCFKLVDLAVMIMGPRRDAWEQGYGDAIEDRLPSAHWFDWGWSWIFEGEHAEHDVVKLRLRGVRRIGGHIDADDYLTRVNNAARLVMLARAASKEERWRWEERHD